MADCAHGCDDGLITVFDADGTERTRFCECRRGQSGFRGGYHPGGRNAKARFRALQRARGRRSGIKRRQLAAGKPPRRRERTQPLALAYAYPELRQLTAAQLEQVDRAYCERKAIPFDRRGFNTRLLVYQWAVTRYRACGQGYEFKNEDVVTYLAEHGRPRKERAVIYARRRLEAMGVFDNQWIKRGTWRRDRGWCRGEKADTIRMTLLHVRVPRANCNLPTGAGASLLRRSASRSPDPISSDIPPPNDSIPPATPADDDRHPPENDRATERAELERAIAFHAMKADAGWNAERHRAELRRLRQALRLLDEAPG